MATNTKPANQIRTPGTRDDGTPITVGGGGRPGVRGRPVKLEFDPNEWNLTHAADGIITLKNDKRSVKKLKLGTDDDSVSVTVPLKGGVTLALTCKE
jgi:hypothetical protein